MKNRKLLGWLGVAGVIGAIGQYAAYLIAPSHFSLTSAIIWTAMAPFASFLGHLAGVRRRRKR